MQGCAGTLEFARHEQAVLQCAQLADEAVCIGEAPSTESYLSIPNIIAAAMSRGADAIHPARFQGLFSFTWGLAQGTSRVRTADRAGVVANSQMQITCCVVSVHSLTGYAAAPLTI